MSTEDFEENSHTNESVNSTFSTAAVYTSTSQQGALCYRCALLGSDAREGCEEWLSY